MMYKTINNKIFKSYDDMYYVSCDGEVYSTYRNKILKWDIDKDGYPRVDIHQKPMKIHKLVYMTWASRDLQGKQINHKDDNKMNPSVDNLYLGTQKDNIRDCIENKTRIGQMKQIVVYDKINNQTIICAPAKHFLDYVNRPQKNGCIKGIFKQLWFKRQFELIEYKQVESVTTKPDECKVVEGRLIPFEVHRQ